MKPKILDQIFPTEVLSRELENRDSTKRIKLQFIKPFLFKELYLHRKIWSTKVWLRVTLTALLTRGILFKLNKQLRKKLEGNYTRMLRVILNKSRRQHPTKPQMYGHLPAITKTIKVRRTRHAGHRWRSRDELNCDVRLWTPSYGRAKAGRPDRTYIQQLCEDTGCSPEDLPEALNDREEWRERVRDICAGGTTWWWWWWWWCLMT